MVRVVRGSNLEGDDGHVGDTLFAGRCAANPEKKCMVRVVRGSNLESDNGHVGDALPCHAPLRPLDHHLHRKSSLLTTYWFESINEMIWWTGLAPCDFECIPHAKLC